MTDVSIPVSSSSFSDLGPAPVTIRATTSPVVVVIADAQPAVSVGGGVIVPPGGSATFLPLDASSHAWAISNVATSVDGLALTGPLGGDGNGGGSLSITVGDDTITPVSSLTVVGATLSGETPDATLTVTGGWNNGNGVNGNVVTSPFSWASGGNNTLPSDDDSFGVANIVAGENITNSGNQTAAFGFNYTATETYSIIGGQSHGTLSGQMNIIGGAGQSNTGLYNAISGSQHHITESYNLAAGTSLTISGPFNIGAGDDNLIAGRCSAVFGQGHQALSDYGALTGINATDRGILGAHGFGILAFGGLGKGQPMRYGLGGVTSDGTTPVVLTFDGNGPTATNQLALPNGQNGALGAAYALTGQIVVTNPATGDSAVVHVRGGIKQGSTAATTAPIGTTLATGGGSAATWNTPMALSAIATVYDIALATATLSFNDDTINGAFQVAAVGIADDDLQFMCDVLTSETTY